MAKAEVEKKEGEGLELTVLTVSSGGLSLMSVMLMRAVAVLDKPKLRLPSMSVAWTMMVYWDTFWNHIDVMDRDTKKTQQKKPIRNPGIVTPAHDVLFL